MSVDDKYNLRSRANPAHGHISEGDFVLVNKSIEEGCNLVAKVLKLVGSKAKIQWYNSSCGTMDITAKFMPSWHDPDTDKGERMSMQGDGHEPTWDLIKASDVVFKFDWPDIKTTTLDGAKLPKRVRGYVI